MSPPAVDMSNSVPCSNDSEEARRSSAENLVGSVLNDAEFLDVLQAVLFRFRPVRIQSQQCKAAARFLGVNEETVRRWLNETTTPKAKDVWPIFFVVLLAELPVDTQKEIMAVLMGLTDE